MIGPTGAVRVMVATRSVDFRKGTEGLAALVRETVGADPFCGAVYVFRAKRADWVKLVWFDGRGVSAGEAAQGGQVLLVRHHGRGRAAAPPAQLQALLEGLDWRRVHDAREIRAPVAAS